MPVHPGAFKKSSHNTHEGGALKGGALKGGALKGGALMGGTLPKKKKHKKGSKHLTAEKHGARRPGRHQRPL